MKHLNSKDEMFNFFNLEKLNDFKEVVEKEVVKYLPAIDCSKINYSQIKSFYKRHKELIMEYRNDPDSYSYEDQMFLDLFAVGSSKNRKESKERSYVFFERDKVKMYFSILYILFIDGIISYDDIIEKIDLYGDSDSLVFLMDRECYEDISLFDPSFVPSVIKRFWNIINFIIHDEYILIDHIDLIKELFVKNFIPLGNESPSEAYGSKEKYLYNSK